mmetsp:Transcript_42957/g.91690  ORF Transcript_42957/g.91690 Transcript_42957/m.91690 type:complete len:280 (+) Transcript_42957:457-1296(+)
MLLRERAYPLECSWWALQGRARRFSPALWQRKRRCPSSTARALTSSSSSSAEALHACARSSRRRPPRGRASSLSTSSTRSASSARCGSAARTTRSSRPSTRCSRAWMASTRPTTASWSWARPTATRSSTLPSPGQAASIGWCAWSCPTRKGARPSCGCTRASSTSSPTYSSVVSRRRPLDSLGQSWPRSPTRPPSDACAGRESASGWTTSPARWSTSPRRGGEASGVWSPRSWAREAAARRPTSLWQGARARGRLPDSARVSRPPATAAFGWPCVGVGA